MHNEYIRIDACYLIQWKIVYTGNFFGDGTVDNQLDLVAELELGWTAYAEANGVIHPETPVAYARPVANGKF